MEYYLEGRIVSLVATEMESCEGWEAQVRGSGGRVYETWIDVFDDDGDDDGEVFLEGECDCPAPSPCKHMAALVCAVRNEVHAPPRQRPSTDRTPKRIKDDLAALRAWSNSLDEQQRGSAKPDRAGSKQSKQLVFIFDISRHPLREIPTLVVHPVTAWERKNGSLGRTSAARIDTMFFRSGSSPRYLSETDMLLWYRLTQVPRGHHWTYHDDPGFERAPRDTELFYDFLATERCYFGGVQGPVLRRGPGRKGTLAWSTDNKGQLRLVVERDDESLDLLLPLQPVHYLDRTTGECGPLELGLPEPVAASIVDLPVLDAETAAQLPRDLSETFERVGIPQPSARRIRWADARPPVPQLRVRAGSSSGSQDDPFAGAYVELAYDYGEMTVVRGVDEPDHDRAYVRVVGDEVIKVPQDVLAETPPVTELQALGFSCLPPDFRRWSPREETRWQRFLYEDVPRLREAGWTVEIDEALPYGVLEPDGWYVDVEEEGSDWFVSVGVDIDGERFNLLPVVVSAIRAGRIEADRLRLDGQAIELPLGDGRWVSLPAERLAKVLDTLVELFDERLDDGALRISRTDVARLLGLDGFDWRGDDRLQAVARKLARRDPLPLVKVPRALRAELRGYQREGLTWLSFLQDNDLGGLLADDMGLGKTIQTLAHVLREKQARRLDRPCLVVAPRSVLSNWARECERFTPMLSRAIYHGPGRERLLAGKLPDLVITTYALLTRDEALRSIEWHVVVLDEAQAIKNPKTRTAKAARDLRARQRLCLTGTPMENNLEDLWSLFTFVMPGLLGGHRSFRQHYRWPIERRGDMDRLAALSARIAPFMLRRTKAQVLAELPPKTEVLVTVPLDARQRDLYEAVRMTMEKKVRDALSQRGLAKSHIVVLDALLKLRQVCCHPTLVKSETARRARAGSAKTQRLLDLLEELVAEGRRTIIFSQFTTMLDLIAGALGERGVAYETLTGKTRDRQAVVDAFQEGDVPVMLVSLKAGGTGLNLTRADTVIHYDPWWNPAVESQATDRAHRIGQDQPVTVYRLVCEGTVEQRMLELQDRKRALTEALQRDAENRAAGGLTLSSKDLELLLAPADQA